MVGNGHNTKTKHHTQTHTHPCSYTLHQEHNLSLQHPEAPSLPVLIWVSIATSKAEVSGLLMNHIQSAQIVRFKVIQNNGSEIRKYL